MNPTELPTLPEEREAALRERIAELERERDNWKRHFEIASDNLGAITDKWEKAESERDALGAAWLKVCHEGNVPQYERVTKATPEGILHGIRQLACMWGGEKLLREKREAKRDGDSEAGCYLLAMFDNPCPANRALVAAFVHRSCGDPPESVQAKLDAMFDLVRAEEMERWEAAFEAVRDAVLNERGPIDGMGFDSDQINAVLSVLDDEFAALGAGGENKETTNG